MKNINNKCCIQHKEVQNQEFYKCRSITIKTYRKRLHCTSEENLYFLHTYQDLSICIPSSTSGKESACQCRRHKRHGFIPGSEEWPGKWHGNLLQYSCLENPMDRGTWQAIVHRVAKSWKRLSMHSRWLAYISFCIKLLSSAFFSKGMICIGSFNVLDTNLLSVIWTANISF